MADPRGWYFLIDSLEKRPWQDADKKPLYRSVDAEPLPPEPEHGASLSMAMRRLLIRLRAVVQPGHKTEGALR